MKTLTTNFGRTIEVGQKVILGKTFGKCKSSEEIITEISKNGMYVKVSNSDKQFSTKSGNAKGSKYSWYIVF